MATTVVEPEYLAARRTLFDAIFLSRLIFRGDKVSWQSKREVVNEGKLTLDLSKDPKHMDIAWKDRTDVTIYVRVGPYLIQCGSRSDAGPKSRPARFASAADDSGSGWYLWVLRIERPDDKPKAGDP